MTPWLLLTVIVALVNLTAFLAIRGRWGRVTLALLAGALAGAALGDAAGRLTGLDVLRIGSYHVLAASIGAQLLMLLVLLFAALLPSGSGSE
ncbi:MAG TPA: hypothetical protein VFK61_02405 [Candidatus Limnocylindria bacterium]|nr:hypothetical protein [Candidatus Limnocylindria bacterium]